MASFPGSTNSSYWTFHFVTTESAVSVANNTSQLKVDVYIGRSAGAGSSYMFGATISCNIDVTGCARQKLVYSNPNTVYVEPGVGKELYLGSKTFVVTHDLNGGKKVTVSASFTNNVSPSEGSASGIVTLTTIPRATTPTLSNTTITLGSSVTIGISPADPSFKHKLRYDFGNLIDQISGLSAGGTDYTAFGTISVTFTPPVNLCNQIPSANSGVCKIWCYTYTSSGSFIGSSALNLTINVPAYNPTINSIALAGNNLLSGEYVQGKSSVSVAINASTLYGASISSYSSVIENKTYAGKEFTSSALTAHGSKSVKVTVKDSRGRTATVDSSAFTVFAYSIPTITEFVLERQEDETTVIATIKGVVSPINNKNAKVVTVTLNGETKTLASSSYNINGTVTFTNVPTDNTLNSTAKIADSYTNVAKNVVLPTVDVTMDFHHSGTGIAFGKVAEHEGLFDCAWPIKSSSVPTLLGGFGTQIMQGTDLNTLAFLNPGNYVCTSATTAGTLLNSPTKTAFKMVVSSTLTKSVDAASQSWEYIFREITDVSGYKWVQMCTSGATGGEFYYNAWHKVLDTKTVKDYVVENNTDGSWTYRKWNNGTVECWYFEKLSSVALTTKMADGVYSNSTYGGKTVYLPTGLLASAPIFTTSNIASSGYTISQVSSFSSSSVTYRIWSPYSSTISGEIHLYVVGKWKT